MKTLTKEERAIVRNYVRMAYKKGWDKPAEHDVTKIIDNYYEEARDEVEKLINKEWAKLEKEDEKETEENLESLEEQQEQEEQEQEMNETVYYKTKYDIKKELDEIAPEDDYRNGIIAKGISIGKKEKMNEDWVRRAVLTDWDDGFINDYDTALRLYHIYNNYLKKTFVKVR